MLIFSLSFLSFSLSLDDIAFGIWTGIEMFESRMIPLAKTWLQFIPEIHVYSDEVPKNQAEAIVTQNNHLNIKFHEIPMFSNYLVGTKHEGKWNSVQSRHLFAIVDLYKRFPNKTWYVLGDDDTYLFPDALLRFLSNQDPDVPVIYGFTFFVFEHINRFFPNPEVPHAFAQGGAGILMTRKIMQMISPFLPMCAEIYTGVNFASDMRLSACIQRFLNMSDDVFQFLPSLHGDTPYKSKTKHQFDHPPITFHHVVPPLIDYVWYASCSVWKDADNVEKYVKWNSIALTELFIEVGREGSLMEIQWGFCIYLDGREGKRFSSLGQPEPVFDEKRYEKRIT
ncbi:hypothetical protein TRFO_18339 [Tritrichomonas foetus]|uniref:Fringe-like glycosyltransferase domain-containing protein n=1 Tax=Tritrichomonas foetus TaxID=1144522 RepID=A0A1J4KL58_9EUKA|nr:hypothetical protein TRFO_18339 [Tritrichomonas foetus]|eukprot:OHT11963.1 hypothetical protein TRFO_18339 [Tritrichomonas foetus]